MSFLKTFERMKKKRVFTWGGLSTYTKILLLRYGEDYPPRREKGGIHIGRNIHRFNGLFSSFKGI
jgi:hypothetical protein